MGLRVITPYLKLSCWCSVRNSTEKLFFEINRIQDMWGTTGLTRGINPREVRLHLTGTVL